MSEEVLRQPDMDEPVPLRKAVGLFFPHGGASVSTLRTEARKGRLAMLKIAGKDFVTRRAIKEMLSRCLDQPKAPASISAKTKTSGSSEMPGEQSALDALDLTLEKLSNGSLDTSPKNTTQKGQVVRLKS